MTRNRMRLDCSHVALNEAERLIETARRANAMLRRGRAMTDVSALWDCSVEYCELALEFFKANDAKKLRALVEDWPLAAIKSKCLRKGRSFDACKTVP